MGSKVCRVSAACILTVALASAGAAQAQAVPASAPTHGAANAVEAVETPQSEAPADGLPPEYIRAASAGLAEFERGIYEEARRHFLKANSIYPNARMLRSLGKVEFELRDYVAALGYLEAALASQIRPLDGPLRADVEGLLGRAREYVVIYSIALSPDDAELSLDGERVGLDANQALLLQVGVHELSATAAGHAPWAQRLDVQAGDNASLDVKLTMDKAPQDDSQDDSQSNTWLIVGSVGGVVLAAVAVGLAVGLSGGGGDEEAFSGNGGVRIGP